MTLTDFLLARIADDAEDARWGRLIDDPEDPESATKILRWDHPRLAAECEAKRRIVAEHPSYEGWGETCATCMTEDTLGGDRWPCATLRALALPYADHPDYRDEWRP